MVGMPVFIDQKDVLKRMEEKGVGLGVPKGAMVRQLLYQSAFGRLESIGGSTGRGSY